MPACSWHCHVEGFPGGSSGKESACNAGDTISIPGSGRSPGKGHGNPLQYSCLENPMDRGTWRATVHGFAKSWTQLKQHSTHTLFCCSQIIFTKQTAGSSVLLKSKTSDASDHPSESHPLI